jgi:hypothetical protein
MGKKGYYFTTNLTSSPITKHKLIDYKDLDKIILIINQ